MRTKTLTLFTCIVAAFLVAGCCSATNGPKGTPVPATPIPATADGRMLGVDLTLSSDNNFSIAYFIAKDAGLSVVQLTPGWDDIEPAKGEYRDPQDNLAAAKAFYTNQGIKVALSVSPLDTNVNRVPADLKGKPMNDREVIGRYNAMLDSVLSKLDGVTLQDVAIGNEVDISLGDNDSQWQQYTDFYNAALAHVKASHPGLKVGVKATFYGLTRDNVDRLKKLNENSDVILVTYYPLNPDFTVRDPSAVKGDFDKICALYPGKEIYFLELGYPSSQLLKSSDEKQAEFIRQTFAAWDEHKDQIKLVNFVYMHDIPQSSVDTMVRYYGLNDPKFAAYLGTLGLRTSDGSDKPAWPALKEEAKARGF